MLKINKFVLCIWLAFSSISHSEVKSYNYSKEPNISIEEALIIAKLVAKVHYKGVEIKATVGYVSLNGADDHEGVWNIWYSNAQFDPLFGIVIPTNKTKQILLTEFTKDNHVTKYNRKDFIPIVK